MTAIEKKHLTVRSKVWLELEGRPVIGEGRVAMLQAIQRHGSIVHASREIGIPYRRMRGAIRDMETALGRPLVFAYRGGGEGGGAVLTPEAQELMANFEKFAQAFQQDADALFLESFG
jgi:molybdate transport system regulatory protein